MRKEIMSQLAAEDPDSYLIADHECHCDLGAIAEWERLEALRRSGYSIPEPAVVISSRKDSSVVSLLPETVQQAVIPYIPKYIRVSHERMLNYGPGF